MENNSTKSIIKNIITRVCTFVIIGVLVVLTTSCGSEEKLESGKYSVDDIFNTIKNSITDLPEVEITDSQSSDAKTIIGNVTDIDYDKIDDFKYCYSTEGLADEIVVISLKNSDNVKKVKADFEAWIETRKDTFKVYNAEEMVKLNAAIIYNEDIYVVLVISKQGQNAKYALKKLFEQ